MRGEKEMINLLAETKEILREHNKTLDDVVWIGCRSFVISKEQFVELANKEYDNDYGGAEVVEDLIVVGEDWWLERGEYDGSEWWEFKELPRKPERLVEVSTLFDRYYGLSDLYYGSENQS